MACGTGKTRVIQELVKNISGRVACPLLLSSSRMLGVNFALGNQCRVELAKVLIIVPLRALLDQFAPVFPNFCKVGTGHNQKINFDTRGFIAVAPSVHRLAGLKFDAVFVDEAHHPLPARMPKCQELYRFSATHTEEPGYRYPMGQAIDDGVLCDYDITVPAVTQHHAYVCLADLLLKQAGRFRRVLAYCNTVAKAKMFQMVLEELGLAAWHINGRTSRKARMEAIEDFSGDLTKPVHVMVAVEVLGEGINIPNADTCMFVEPRNSYRSVIQAIGRVLRHHPCKTLAHIVLPAVTVPATVGSQAFSSDAAGSAMEEANGIVTGRAVTRTEHERPQQAFTDLELPVVDMSKQNEGEPAGACKKDTCWPTESTTSREVIVDAAEASTQKDRAGLPTFRRGKNRGVSNAEEEKTAQEERGEGIRNVSFNLVPSSSSTWSSAPPASASASVPRAPVPSHRQVHEVPVQFPKNPDSQQAKVDLSPTPQIPSASGQVAESSPLSPGYLVREREVNHCDHYQGEHGADPGYNDHATIKEAIQQDAALWEERHDRDCARSPIEPRARRSSAVEAQALQRVPGPRIRRVQLKSNVAPADPNELYGTELERFLSLLVQADSRLVGSSVGYRIQLVDCRMTVEGQELDSLTEAVYRRLTAILCQSDPWEDNLQSLEALVEKKGRLPSRRVRAERHFDYWLNTQRSQIQAGLLLEHRWRRLVNSTSSLIRQRVQRWPQKIFDRRWLELKAYIETNNELPRQTPKTPNLQSHRLALWLNGLKDREAWTKPDRRATLESLHPLMAELLAKWGAKAARIDLPVWQRRLQRLVAWVQAKGRLPSSTGSETALYDWLNRNLRRLRRLPQDLVKQLLHSHPLIAAKVRAAQAKQMAWAGLKKGLSGRAFDNSGVRCGCCDSL